MDLDLYIFELIYRRTFGQKWLEWVGIFLAQYCLYVMIIGLGVYAFVIDNSLLFFLPLSAGLFARFTIVNVVYVLYDRRRPPQVLNIRPLIRTPKYPSFPSSHASLLTALSLTLLLFSQPLAIAFLVLTGLVVLSRIFVGVHWPSDVVGGVIVGILTFWLLAVLRK